MVETKDIVIIGSGPSGTMASIESAKRGAEIVVLENDPVVGDPNHCSGLISVKGLKNLNVPIPANIIENSIQAVNFYSPSNYKMTIKRKKRDELRVFQRNELDRVLFRYAQDKYNVEGRFNARVTGLTKENGKITGVNVKPKGAQSYTIKSKLVIDASGSLAKFIPEAGLQPPDPKWRLPAMQFELDNVDDIPRDYVELYHGS